MASKSRRSSERTSGSPVRTGSQAYRLGSGRPGSLPSKIQDPVTAVRPVVAQRFAGPLPGDEHPTAGVAEVFGPMRFAPAGARAQPVAGALGLDAGPMLTATDRRRLLTNLRGAAENPSAPADRISQVRRQVAYLASFVRAPDTTRWLSALRASVARTDAGSRFSPGWAEARSIAVALGRQGNPEALDRFVQLGRTDDTWRTANLNYWAYWSGETRGIERDDAFMGEGLGRWRGLTLLDHLTARLGPDADDLVLNVHTVWALIVARRGILEDDPVLARSLADRVVVLLDSTAVAPAVRSEAESIRSALTMAGVRT